MFKILAQFYFLQNLLGKIVASFIPPFLVHNLGKYFAIKKAFYLSGLEDLEGDYLEFGVFTGSSMGCALQCARSTRIPGVHKDTRFFGFDSFEGFGRLDAKDNHPFYKNLNFETDFFSVERRLKKIAASHQPIKLIKGFFDKTCDGIEPNTYGIRKAAVVLIDCDTLGAAESCFAFIQKTIQIGTIIILDDFFSYRGRQNLGVCGAFEKWSQCNERYKFRNIADYGMGGRMFIVSSDSKENS